MCQPKQSFSVIEITKQKVKSWEEKKSLLPKMAANIGLSKVFILDKYFKELQKFWETEKKLQGKKICENLEFFLEKN